MALLPSGVKQFMLVQQQYRCGLCAEPLTDPASGAVAPIVPGSRNKNDRIFNLRVVHRHCNEMNANQHAEQASAMFPNPFNWDQFIVEGQTAEQGRSRAQLKML